MIKMLTDITWAKVDHLVDRKKMLEGGWRWGWEQDADLARQLAADLSMDEGQARLLIGAATSGNPIVLSWDTVLRNQWGPTTTEHTTATVTVRYVTHWPNAERQQPARVRIRYWGFEYDVYSDQITGARTPDVERTYS